MRIGFVQYGDYHLEVLGMFLTYCKLRNIEIYLFCNSDSCNWIEYYKKQFGVNIQVNHENNFRLFNFDYIIFLTSNEYLNVKDKLPQSQKVITICHTKKEKELSYHNVTNIALSPLVDDLYLLPIYNKPKKNRICMIGYFDRKDFTDIERFLENDNNELFIFTRQKTLDLQKFLCYSNLQVFYNKSIDEILVSIKNLEIKMLWICPGEDSYHTKDRLSGSIPFAINMNIKLIMPRRLRDIYKGIECEVYDNSIMEFFHRKEFHYIKNEFVLDCIFEFIKCKDIELINENKYKIYKNKVSIKHKIKKEIIGKKILCYNVGISIFDLNLKNHDIIYIYEDKKDEEKIIQWTLWYNNITNIIIINDIKNISTYEIDTAIVNGNIEQLENYNIKYEICTLDCC